MYIARANSCEQSDREIQCGCQRGQIFAFRLDAIAFSPLAEGTHYLAAGETTFSKENYGTLLLWLAMTMTSDRIIFSYPILPIVIIFRD